MLRYETERCDPPFRGSDCDAEPPRDAKKADPDDNATFS